MKIGSIDLGECPVFLAPMEDVTDISFRLMCKRFGADMVYTEFVSSDALIRSVNKTQQKLNVSDDERPVAIQIYGKDVASMVEAARPSNYRIAVSPPSPSTDVHGRKCTRARRIGP